MANDYLWHPGMDVLVYEAEYPSSTEVDVQKLYDLWLNIVFPPTEYFATFIKSKNDFTEPDARTVKYLMYNAGPAPTDAFYVSSSAIKRRKQLVNLKRMSAFSMIICLKRRMIGEARSMELSA